MAKKVLLQDLNNVEILPITRGELVLDSSGKKAFHSSEFLATTSLPGLMSAEDKHKLDNYAGDDTTYNLVSVTADGLAPKIGNSAELITTQEDEWVLTSTKGETPSWRKLPINAFNNTLVANSKDADGYVLKGFGQANKVWQTDADGNPAWRDVSAHIHSTNNITLLTDYTKGTEASDLATTDTLNVALGKLEYKTDIAYNLIQGAYDGDGTIENLNEILKVLEGIKDTETIQAIIGKYLPLTGGTLTGKLTIEESNFGSLIIYRKDSANSASIQFKNGSNVSLGYLGMNTANGNLFRFSADTSTSYKIWDSGNDGSGSGLDADLLDGVHANGLLTALSSDKTTNLSVTVGGTTKNITNLYARQLGLSSNTITSTTDDTTAKWGPLGTSVHFYGTKDQLTDQPLQYGLLLNVSNTSSEVHQIWMTQASGNLYHRGGNSAGWSGSWRTILDSVNTHIKSGVITINGTTITPLTQHQSLANYVTLDGTQTISGVKTFNAGNVPIKLNSTGIKVGVQFLLNGTAKGWVGHTNITGTYIYNYPSAKYIGVKDDGTPYYYSGGFKTLLHSDNYTEYTVTKTGTGASGTWGINISGNADTVDNLHASDLFRAYGTLGTGNSYDSDWGQSIVTFDPVVNGTYPESNPNVTILNLGNNYARRKQLAFNYNNNNIYFRRRVDSYWQPWVRLALASEIPAVTNYYWADQLITSSAKSNATPTFGNVNIKSGTDAGLAIYTSGDYSRIRFYNSSNSNNATIHYFATAYSGYTFAKYSLNVGGKVTIGAWNNPTMFITQNTSTTDTSGCVGIGTTSPTSKLHVVGDVRLTGTNPAVYIRNTNTAADTYSIIRFGNADGDNKAYIFLNGPSRTSDGGQNVMTIRNNVGYLRLDNATSVTGLLTVTSGSTHCGIKVGNNYINAINGELIIQNNTAIRFGDDSWDYDVWAGLKYVHSSKTISLGLADGTHFTANSAQSGGTMQFPGIGTFRLNGTVHINPPSGSYVEGIRMHPSSEGWTALVFCGDDNTADSGTSAKTWGLFTNGGNFYINKNSSSTSTGYELCNVSGNWGIGTTDPSQKLSVNGAIYTMQPSTNRQAGIIGTYDPNRAAAIWSMGDAYQISTNGLSFGGLYGAAYAYFGSGYTFGAKYSIGHSFVWCQAGTPSVALGNNIWTKGSLIADCDGYGTVKIYGTSGGSRMIEDLGTANGFYIKTNASWGMTIKVNTNEVVIGNNTKAMYTNQVLDLGTSSKPWGNIYGTLKGDADTVDGYHIQVVSSLPASRTNNTIYIVI